MTDASPDVTALLAGLLARRESPFAAQLRERLQQLSGWLYQEVIATDGIDDAEENDLAWALHKTLAELLRYRTPPAVPSPADQIGETPAESGQDAPGSDEPKQEQELKDPRSEPKDGQALAVLENVWQGLADSGERARYVHAYGDVPDASPTEQAQWLLRRLDWVALRLTATEAARIRVELDKARGLLGLGEPGELLASQPLPNDDPLAGHSFAALAGTLRAMRLLADQDETIQCGLYSASASGPTPFSDKETTRFDYHLNDHVKKLAATRAGSADELTVLAKLDEIARGLVPVPVPERGSAWFAALDRFTDPIRVHPARSVLTAVDVIEPAGQYAVLKHLFGDAKKISLEQSAPGTKVGEVVWILRNPRSEAKDDRGRCLYVDK